MFDRYRILPRTIAACWLAVAVWAAIWFMTGSDQGGDALAFVALIWGAGAASAYKFWSHVFPKRGDGK